LSYSDFEFTNLECPEQVKADNKEDICISIDVTNRSNTDGTTIVQLYFRDMVSSISTPVKQFKGFERVFLKAGESKKVKLLLPMNELAYVDHDLKWVIEKGIFRVIVGDGTYLERDFEVV